MTTTVTYPVMTEEQFATIASEDPAKTRYHSGGYTKNISESATTHPISSVIISEELLCEAPPEHTIRYVEVPIIEEVVKTVPVKSVVEIEKLVPRYEIQHVEKIIEIPQIEYIDHHVEKEHIQEIIREVPGELEVREIPRTVVRKIPKIEYETTEKTVEVPGEVVQISKDYVETLPPVRKYRDVEVPVVVAQTIRPVITQTDSVVDVDVFEYEPQIMPVDVYVATPITSKLVAAGAEDDVYHNVSVPPAQYNTILKSLNAHIPDAEAQNLPFIKTNNSIGLLAHNEAPGYVQLEADQLTQLQTVNSDDQMEQLPKDLIPYDYSSDDRLLTKHNEDSIQMGLGSVPQKKPQLHDKKKRICGC